VSFRVQDRVALVGSREAIHATYRDIEGELAVVDARLHGLAKHRSIGEIKAEITTLLARGVSSAERLRGTIGSLSLNCVNCFSRFREAETGRLVIRTTSRLTLNGSFQTNPTVVPIDACRPPTGHIHLRTSSGPRYRLPSPKQRKGATKH
jgi:hypothetical protein